eukprot:scaffold225712_cov32-Tisochrysis_lutea.AAC.6
MKGYASPRPSICEARRRGRGRVDGRGEGLWSLGQHCCKTGGAPRREDSSKRRRSDTPAVADKAWYPSCYTPRRQVRRAQRTREAVPSGARRSRRASAEVKPPTQ